MSIARFLAVCDGARISARRGQVLMLIRDKGVGAAAIARELGISPAAMTSHLDGLERLGLLDRGGRGVPDRSGFEDRRKVRLVLSARGARLADRLLAIDGKEATP